ncbi:MAG: GNAT family N-acetyltransferase [Bacteroidia bacterium]|nr:GNAT family N-acetyltransferase [Bacteroidia bacterium]
MKEDEFFISTDAELIRKSGWREFVLSHPDGNFFQLPEAFDLFKKVPGYTPQMVALLRKQNNEVCGLLLSVLQQEPAFYGFLTARSIVWGGPLLKETSHADVVLSAYKNSIRKTAIYSQFRNVFDCSHLKASFLKQGFRYAEHLNFHVHTRVSGSDLLLGAMSKSKARQIRKGLSSASIEESTNPADTDTFYELLRKLYREKVNKPLPPKIFFDTFRDEIAAKGLGKFLLVRHEGKIIGGIMCPVFPGKAIYEWYIAGLDKEFKEQYPSILATWAALACGQKEGLMHFDFLGAGKPDADYGVRDFKAKFGGEEVNFGRFEMIHRPVLMKIGTLGLKLYKFIRR